jgi:hypothetical protein
VFAAVSRTHLDSPAGYCGPKVLGLVSEIPSRREARILLQDRLAALNSGQRRAQPTMSFGAFVTEHFEPIALPTLKPAAREIYSFLLRKHLLRRFRDYRLCSITLGGTILSGEENPGQPVSVR